QIAEQAAAVLAKMAAAVKPGGWLFVCEPDFNLVRTCEPEVWANAWAGILPWGQTEGVDWCIGRKLPAMVNALGLGYPEAKTEVPDIRGTTLDAASAMLADPDYWTQCWMLTSVWLRKQQVAISNP